MDLNKSLLHFQSFWSIFRICHEPLDNRVEDSSDLPKQFFMPLHINFQEDFIQDELDALLLGTGQNLTKDSQDEHVVDIEVVPDIFLIVLASLHELDAAA